MKNILVIGAGRSATSLIRYLTANANAENWSVTVADYDRELALAKTKGAEHTKAIQLDIKDEENLGKAISEADVVVSMVPATFHPLVAKVCLKLKKHLVSASYVSPEIEAMDADAKQAGIIMLKECGLDPGIDHMSAMLVLDRLRIEGSELTGFETFTGGLLAPSNDDNPWEYKFTWNPGNVVKAGNGTVKFIQENRYKFIPYHRLFRRTEMIHIPDHGYFEGYANRDSLKYLDIYGLQGIRTLYRGTLRRPSFCRAWDIFVQLGATDDSYEMENVAEMTHRQFINSFLSYNPNDSVELKLAHYTGLDLDSEEMFKLKWLGMFEEELVGIEKGTPAQILEHILKKKWTLNEDERDMIVMWHKFDFVKNGENHRIESHMVLEGEDSENTAMSLTVGLPMGIAVKKILSGDIKLTGVQRPVVPEIYEPILSELESHGIVFKESETVCEK
ncbi:saccharopine dehydrogenase [Fulvitalea axinellae]|uniref:Saccharopine dehydrogenase n=1 Tax=Fulvitalea axinellae TaxID=1182444 RepID=A0AAU9CLU9_9BACT|nr:saccharopine dehydrogenase [Fulvitalea axinellae]